MSSRRSSRADGPLARWGDALRAGKVHRRTRRKVFLAMGVAGVLACLAPTDRMHPLLVWNISESAPIGLYVVNYRTPIGRGDMVIARLPAAVRALADQRHYIPQTIPLVKNVAAGSGDEVCALGAELFLNGRPIVKRRARDGRGRLLPTWTGCRTLQPDELFLLMPANPLSFDGRYFGISKRGDMIGRATLLWAR
jgi:conjugative transfer signal peptidase TraF